MSLQLRGYVCKRLHRNADGSTVRLSFVRRTTPEGEEFST
jgi:hypothetical protein